MDTSNIEVMTKVRYAAESALERVNRLSNNGSAISREVVDAIAKAIEAAIKTYDEQKK